MASVTPEAMTYDTLPKLEIHPGSVATWQVYV